MTWMKVSRAFIQIGVVVYLGKYFLRKDFLVDYIYYDLESNYLHWSSKLPAISVCQSFKNNRSLDGTGDFLKSLINPSRVYCRQCDKGRKLEKKYNTILAIVYNTILPCEELVVNCRWNGKSFNCCDRFKKLVTRKGICYSVNSEVVSTPEKFEVSFFSKDADLKFEITNTAKVYLHEVRDVLPKKGIFLKPGEKLDVLYRSRETIADPATRWLKFDVRKCILQGELWNGVYSKSICKNNFLAQAQIRLCNCTHHFVQEDLKNHCDLDGLECLDQNSRKISAEMASVTSCSEACDEIVPTIIWKKVSRHQGKGAQANFVLSSPPTERLIMKSKTNALERLVALACISRWLTNYSLMDIGRIVMRKIFGNKRFYFDNSILY